MSNHDEHLAAVGVAFAGSRSGQRGPPGSEARPARPVLRAGTVIFDCDSTLSAIEGIDALAGSQLAEVHRLTESAMSGSARVEDVFGHRLNLVRPTRARVEALASDYARALVPDAREVLDALRAEGIAIRLVSGGLRPAVTDLGRRLGIAAELVAAVDIYFDAEGEYNGFDTRSPLARSGGKAELLAEWRTQLRRPVMLVGDGMSDLEARPAVDLFVAFAGVVEREAVVRNADLVVRSRSLAPILPLALGGNLPRDDATHALFEKGLALLEPEYRAQLDQRFVLER